MFSQAYIILFRGGLASQHASLVIWQGVCLWEERGLHPGGGGLHPGVCLKGRGVCIQGGLPTGGGGVCIHVGWPDTPPIPWDTIYKRAVRILLKCLLVSSTSTNSINFLLHQMLRILFSFHEHVNFENKWMKIAAEEACSPLDCFIFCSFGKSGRRFNVTFSVMVWIITN